MSSTIAICILNWNGVELLKKFLPTVILYSRSYDVYVIDNYSTDDSITYLKSIPEIHIIYNQQNLGFAGGYNEGLKSIQADYFVLLNSDVLVTENWIEPIISFMQKELTVAACQPKIKDYKSPAYFEYAGAAGGLIDKYGYPYCKGRVFNEVEQDKGQYNTPYEIFWASGAALFIRSSIYNELGGLDNDFFAHMEEIDLCWRIKNKGHEIYYIPQSEVYHVGGATLSSSNPRKTYLNFRNNLYLLFKNDFRVLWLGYLFCRMVLDGVAAIRFLVIGEKQNFAAIFKAHMHFYVALQELLRKRKYNKSQLKKPISYKLQKAIFFDFFVLKKSTQEISNS